MAAVPPSAVSSLTENEERKAQEANESARTPVVAVHGTIDDDWPRSPSPR
jgi:hypothetical protein